MADVNQIDVTRSKQSISDFARGLRRAKKPIDLMVNGEVVGRIVSPGELSEAEKEEVVRKGWQFIQQARARNRRMPEKEIGHAVDAAVKRVRAAK